MNMIEKREKNALAYAYSFRIRAKGITFDSKALRRNLLTYDNNEINDYMANLLAKNNNEIINDLSSIGVKAKNNKKISRINMVINEIKKRFPNNEIKYNDIDNTFSVIGNENITLKLVKENNKYNITKVNSEENTNSSNTNSKGKQYTLSNGKASSKLFTDEENN